MLFSFQNDHERSLAPRRAEWLRHSGIHRGLVDANADPQSLMCLLEQVPAELGTQEVWALPYLPIGTSVVPITGKGVWIMFESGDSVRPVWMGTWSCTE